MTAAKTALTFAAIAALAVGGFFAGQKLMADPESGNGGDASSTVQAAERKDSSGDQNKAVSVEAKKVAKPPKASDRSKNVRRGFYLRRGKAPAGACVFPDGTWHPPLNGVKAAPPFPGFAEGYKYSPVVKIVHGDGNIDWFQHADGSVSTTQLLPTMQHGRKFIQAGWAVGNPAKTLAIDTSLGSPDGTSRIEKPSVKKQK